MNTTKEKPSYYMLGDDNEVIGIDDIMVWGQWFENADRHVDKTKIGDVEVSTVFLGLDHNFIGDIPILWETMIFGLEENDPLEEYQERYSSFDDAKEGHLRAVELVKDNRKVKNE